MEHQIYKEWIPLAVDKELSRHELSEFEKHLDNCVECQFEFEEQKKLKSFLLENNTTDLDDNFLFEARQELRGAIRAERAKQSVWKKLLRRFEFLTSPTFRLAFGGVAVLFIGFLTGYLVFNKPEIRLSDSSGHTLDMHTISGKPGDQNDSFAFSQNDIRIGNIRFIDQDASDGEIEFIFDAIKPVRMKGNVNDEKIKNVLTYAMLNVENAGVRLNSINMIGANQKSNSDVEIKAALVSVAKFDENPGVRREAIMLLSKFVNDEEVKNTLLYVLVNDKISGNRIEAINSLMQAQKEGVKFNDEELSVFKKMKVDENRYIRYQAKTVLEESK